MKMTEVREITDIKEKTYAYRELSEYAKTKALHDWVEKITVGELEPPHKRIYKKYYNQIREINKCLENFFQGFEIDLIPKYATNNLDILDATITIKDFKNGNYPTNEVYNLEEIQASEIKNYRLRDSLEFMSLQLDKLNAVEDSVIDKYSFGCFWTYLFLRGKGEKEYLKHLGQFSFLKKPLKYSLLGVMEFLCYSMLENFKREIANSTLNDAFEEDIDRYGLKFNKEGQIISY